MSYKLLLLLACAVFIKSVSCFNILVINNMPSPSHQIWNFAIAEALIAKGHNVTMLGPNWLLKQEKKHNYHPIDLEGLFEQYDNLDPNTMAGISPFGMMMLFYDYSIVACNHSYNTDGFKKLMNYPKDFKFDLIIFDLTVAECMLPLIQVFNYPPAIGMTALLLPPFLSEQFGNDIQPSYLPSMMLKYLDEMNFFQRLCNYFWLRLDGFLRDVYLKKSLENLALQTFGSKMDSMTNLQRHVSLLFCNLNPVFHFPQPLTPNIIPVGGIHIKPAGTLPKDIQEIMDKAEHGVILFSLGTNIRSDLLTADKRNAILDALKRVKQTVLWKFESAIADLPKNVIVRKWLPQTEILAHPNIRVFISHGGGLSTLEAAHFGVPIVGIPFFVDQHLNVDWMVKREISLKVNYPELTSESLYDALNELLSNPKYTNGMKEISRRMLDRQSTPTADAVFWSEYAIRHNGTQFLNTRSRDMPLFVKSCADVQLFLLFVIVSLGYILCKATRTVISCLKRKTKDKSE